jgi:hypothetical protein
MTVLGPAIIDNCQQREMERGNRELIIPRERVFNDAAARAKVGDIWWVKESFCEVKSGPTTSQIIHEMLPGSPLGVSIPPRLKPIFHLLRKHFNRRPSGLRRAESRACLKIIEITDEGFRCTVEMVNVDVFLCRAA